MESVSKKYFGPMYVLTPCFGVKVEYFCDACKKQYSNEDVGNILKYVKAFNYCPACGDSIFLRDVYDRSIYKPGLVDVAENLVTKYSASLGLLEFVDNGTVHHAFISHKQTYKVHQGSSLISGANIIQILSEFNEMYHENLKEIATLYKGKYLKERIIFGFIENFKELY